jgi:hypothetical protein
MAEKTLKQLYDDLRRSAGFAVVTGTLESRALPPNDPAARERALELVRDALAAQVEASFGESAAQHFARLSAMESRLGNHLLSIEDSLGVSLRQIAQTESRLNEMATRIEGLGETLGHAMAQAEASPRSKPIDAAALQTVLAPLQQEIGALRRHVVQLEAAASRPAPRAAADMPPNAPHAAPPAVNDSIGAWIAAVVATLIGGILIGLYGNPIADSIIVFFQRSFG